LAGSSGAGRVTADVTTTGADVVMGTAVRGVAVTGTTVGGIGASRIALLLLSIVPPF